MCRVDQISVFEVIYKCVKLTTKEDLKDLVPESSTNILLFGMTNYLLSILILLKPFQFIPYSFLTFAFSFVGLLCALYFLNKKLFIQENNYENIERYYDRKNKLKKIHFVFIVVVYMLLSVCMMIYVGINYVNTGK